MSSPLSLTRQPRFSAAQAKFPYYDIFFRFSSRNLASSYKPSLEEEPFKSQLEALPTGTVLSIEKVTGQGLRKFFEPVAKIILELPATQTTPADTILLNTVRHGFFQSTRNFIENVIQETWAGLEKMYPLFKETIPSFYLLCKPDALLEFVKLEGPTSVKSAGNIVSRLLQHDTVPDLPGRARELQAALTYVSNIFPTQEQFLPTLEAMVQKYSRPRENTPLMTYVAAWEKAVNELAIAIPDKTRVNKIASYLPRTTHTLENYNALAVRYRETLEKLSAEPSLLETAILLAEEGVMPDRLEIISKFLAECKDLPVQPRALFQALKAREYEMLTSEQFDTLLDLLRVNKTKLTSVDFLEQLPQVVSGVAKKYALEFEEVLSAIMELPDRWAKCPMLSTSVNISQDLRQTPEDLRVFTLMGHPDLLLNHYIRHMDDIDPNATHMMYYLVDISLPPEQGKIILPELMALTRPFIDSLDRTVYPPNTLIDKHKNARIGRISQAITRLYSYTSSAGNHGSISQVKPLTLDNWARIGELGLSYTKWKYDTMTQWKGQGKKVEQASIMERSGLFTKVPPRENDAVFHGGFYHYNPETGLSVEMRRGYIVISTPDEGSLVIRNSSKLFGRDLMEEPAYYDEHRTYTDESNLFKPAEDLGFFDSVLDKPLNRTLEKQTEVHGKIKKLLDAFDELMDQYFVWKSQVKNDVFPEGFRNIIETALKSGQNKGAFTPYSGKKFLGLGWVNRYGLPFRVKKFELKNNPKQLQQLEAFHAFINNRSPLPNGERLAKAIPELYEFLSYGLTHGLELVLIDPE